MGSWISKDLVLLKSRRPAICLRPRPGSPTGRVGGSGPPATHLGVQRAFELPHVGELLGVDVVVREVDQEPVHVEPGGRGCWVSPRPLSPSPASTMPGRRAQKGDLPGAPGNPQVLRSLSASSLSPLFPAAAPAPPFHPPLAPLGTQARPPVTPSSRPPPRPLASRDPPAPFSLHGAGRSVQWRPPASLMNI